MEKECCQIKITELDNGYRVEITGEHIKENCDCCRILQSCCGPKNTAGSEKQNC